MSTDTTPVVTIDGPSGAGKGTVAWRVAEKLGFNFLDSGAVYRAAALHCMQQGVAIDSATAVVAAIKTMKLNFKLASASTDAGTTAGDIRVLLGETDVTRDLRSETTADAASRVAVMPEVRKALLQVQRDFRAHPGLVADGRDMGTVVFPQALVKIFLTANAEVRARRRQKQLKEQGMEAKLAGLMQEIERRDLRDSTRKHAPLIAAADAIAIETSDLGIEETTNLVLEKVNARLESTKAAAETAAQF